MESAEGMDRVMEVFPVTATEQYPATVFRYAEGRLEILHPGLREKLGLTQQEWNQILAGGWRGLVPEEFHPEVEKLFRIAAAESYTLAEFPVRFRETVIWLRIAAAVTTAETAKTAGTDGTAGSQIVGLARDVSRQRHSSLAMDAAETDLALQPENPYGELCHDLSGPLTSIIVQCDLLLEDDCPPSIRQKLESIFSEALRLQQRLRAC